MWIIHSFRREKTQHVTKWRSRIRCYMGLICWTIGTNDFDVCTNIVIKYGIMGLVPVAIGLVILIVPICYMELAIGQFSKCSYMNVWRLSPPFKGIGYTCIYLLAATSMHLNLRAVILLRYVVGSIQSPVPWLGCLGDWVEDNCYVQGKIMSTKVKCQSNYNESYCKSLKWESSAIHYWNQVVVKEVPVIGSDKISLERLMFSALTSLLIFLMLRKGVSTLQLFAPVLALAPHIMQFILFVVVMVLPGASRAVSTYFVQTGKYFGSVDLWQYVFSEILTGTNVGLGGNILFGSESGDFRTPIHLAAIGVYLLDFLLATMFALFSSITLAAFCYYANIDNIDTTGEGSMFYSVSTTFSAWPIASQPWCLLYFCSLYIMCVRTKAFFLHSLLSGIYEIFPSAKHYYDLCGFIITFVDFWVGLSYFEKHGLIHADHRTSILKNTCTLFIIIYESSVITFIYGANNLIDDAHFMLGFRSGNFIKLCWYAAPFTALTLLGLSCQVWIKNVTFLRTNDHLWFIVFMAISLGVCISMTPAYMVYHLFRHRKRKKWYLLMKPSNLWGPFDPILKRSREMFASYSMTKEYIYRQLRQSRQFNVESVD